MTDWGQVLRQSRGITEVKDDPQYHRIMYGAAVEMLDKYPCLYDDVEFMTEAMRHNGSLLEISGDAVADNEEAVLVAVGNEGPALQYASHRLRDNDNVVMAAICGRTSGGPPAIAYASERLRNDRTMAMAAIEHDPNSLLYLPVQFRYDTELVNEAARILGISPQRVMASVEEAAHSGGVSVIE